MSVEYPLSTIQGWSEAPQPLPHAHVIWPGAARCPAHCGSLVRIVDRHCCDHTHVHCGGCGERWLTCE